MKHVYHLLSHISTNWNVRFLVLPPGSSLSGIFQINFTSILKFEISNFSQKNDFIGKTNPFEIKMEEAKPPDKIKIKNKMRTIKTSLKSIVKNADDLAQFNRLAVLCSLNYNHGCLYVSPVVCSSLLPSCNKETNHDQGLPHGLFKNRLCLMVRKPKTEKKPF